nr:unnamed protein product [Naegleria fowleri]
MSRFTNRVANSLSRVQQLLLFLLVVQSLLVVFFTRGVSSSFTSYYISPSGQDSNNGQSSSTPFKTFSKAFSTMKGGDELILMDGTYSEAVGTGYMSWQGTNSGQPPSGLSPTTSPTRIRALNPGKVLIQGELFIGRSFRKDSNITVSGITFEGDSEIYNCNYCTVKNCEFHGSFWIGTNDHDMDNQFNLIEDCWIWGSQRRIISGNYRANYNVWRRVVVRGDGCGQPECQGDGNPNVGFTVYDSHDNLIENMIVVDRILAPNDAPYSDFAAAQHTPLPIWYNGRNKWLGCMSINAPDTGFYLEPDDILDPTFILKNCVAVNAHDTGINVGRKASNILYEIHTFLCTVGITTTDPTKSSPPALKYPTRVEANSFLKGVGYSKMDIGANVMTKYGWDGARVGDVNVETMTTNSLWPWPNEDRIKKEMCAYTTRGFCSMGKQLNGVNTVTLTSYIWEILGNAMPSDIYQQNTTTVTCFGLAASNQNVCSGKGVCISTDWCQCDSGYYGNACQIASCFGVLATNATVCSSRGSCTSLNQCSCQSGFTRSNCQTKVVVVTGSSPKASISQKRANLASWSFHYDHNGWMMRMVFMSMMMMVWMIPFLYY